MRYCCFFLFINVMYYVYCFNLTSLTQRRNDESLTNLYPLLSCVLGTRNIALRKDAFMLSYIQGTDARNGVDGNEISHFHTAPGNYTWWAVDLGQGGARVTTVRVVNRKRCGELAT